MNIFKTSGICYINLDQVTIAVCDADQVTLHFDGEHQTTLRGDDAKKLTQIIAERADEFEGRVLRH
jgi:hypothetical protein